MMIILNTIGTKFKTVSPVEIVISAPCGVALSKITSSIVCNSF
jgi:hypothetical protein